MKCEMLVLAIVLLRLGQLPRFLWPVAGLGAASEMRYKPELKQCRQRRKSVPDPGWLCQRQTSS